MKKTSNEPLIDVKKVIKLCGGALKLAEDLGMNFQPIYRWKRVPAERCLRVSELSGIPLYVLRPDVYPMEMFSLISVKYMAAEEDGPIEFRETLLEPVH